MNTIHTTRPSTSDPIHAAMSIGFSFGWKSAREAIKSFMDSSELPLQEETVEMLLAVLDEEEEGETYVFEHETRIETTYHAKPSE